MAIPVIPLLIGAAGLGVLFSGTKSASGSPGGAGAAPSGLNATPTQQSTGGTNGGAQAASHADYSNTQIEPVGEVNINVGSGSTPTNYLTAPTMPTPTAPGPDSWSPSPGASLEPSTVQTSPGGALGAIGTVGGLTVKAVGDAFSSWGSQFGAIW
jgi:hypothetical protein